MSNKVKIVALALMSIIGAANAILWGIIGVDIIFAVNANNDTAMFGVTATNETALLAFYMSLMGIFIWLVTIFILRTNKSLRQWK